MRNDVTRANAVSERKKSFRKFDFFSFAVWTNVKRKKRRQTMKQKKNIAGQVLTHNSKNFHWLNRKLDLERTMNGLEKPFRKNPIQKIEKTVKIKVKLPHMNKKPLARKRIFCSRRHTTRFFAPLPVSAWPKSLLQFDFKNHENVWTYLKKRHRPNTIQILWIVKNQEHRNIASLSLQLRSYKKALKNQDDHY